MTYSRTVHCLAWLMVFAWSVYAFRVATDEQHHEWVSSDVGWQWMLGCALVNGELSQSYTIEAGERWLRQGYTGSELDRMSSQLFRKGREKEPVRDGIDGPLYPPTAAFVFGVYGMLSPRQAHSLGVLLGLFCTYCTAALIQWITRGRLPAGFAALVILFFPHHFPGLLLGQNHAFTLLLLAMGWWLLGRGKSFLAGLVWGLLIYKPVFLLALLLIPLSLFNLRLFLGMAACALILFLSTLPFTQGLAPWKRWVVVGQRASVIYELDRRWIWLSRDLSGMPRRAMWNPESFLREWGYWWKGEAVEPVGARTHLEQDQQGRVKSPSIVKFLGWALPAAIALLTVMIFWRRTEEGLPNGLPAAFLWMGVCWSVLHFMHYDLTMFSLPICLLLAEQGRMTRTQRTVIIFAMVGLFYCTINFHRMGVYSLLAIPWECFILFGLWTWLAAIFLFTPVFHRIEVHAGKETL